MTALLNLKSTLEGQLAEGKRRNDELSAQLNKLREELNLKLSFIQKLEQQLRASESTNQSLVNSNNVLVQQLEGLKNNMLLLTNQLEETKIRLTIITDRDNEIAKLKLIITQCKAEWERLSESYDSLLIDVKKQIELNQALVIVISDMHGKMERHNGSLGVIDLSIRQQIEVLTKEALFKQRLDYSTSSDTIQKCQAQLEDIKSKVGKVEGQRLNKSAVYPCIVFSSDSFQSSGRVVDFEFHKGGNQSFTGSSHYEQN